MPIHQNSSVRPAYPSNLLAEVSGSFTEEAERQSIQIQISTEGSEAYRPRT